MLHWKNLDTLKAFEKLKEKKGSVNLPEAMAGESGAQRVSKYTVPMACGLAYNYAAKAVDDELLSIRLPERRSWRRSTPRCTTAK